MTDSKRESLHAAWSRAVDALMLADEHQEAAARAESNASRKAHFLAAMAHELKNPLNAISGYVQLMQLMAEPRSAIEANRYLDTIGRASQHLAALVDDALWAAKLDSGKAGVDLGELEISDVIIDVDKLIRPQVEKGNNRLDVAIADDVGRIVSDRIKLQQILINLLSNAAKFTRDGTISLRVLRPDTGHLLLRVEDSGRGMTPQQLSRLYDAFTDIGGRDSSALGGTGLGMFITRNLCQLLGGDISVVSTPGTGTRFDVRLPALAQQNTAVERPPRDRILAIGVREGLPQSDPHLNATEIDFYCAQHMFEGLTCLDREGNIRPSLATGWCRLDDVTWEFELKRGVLFHDGSHFDADDVLASLERLRRIERGGLNNNQILAVIRDVQAVDRYRICIETFEPHLTLPLDLVEMHVIQRRFVDATTSDFDSGRAAVGTGPFRQIDRTPAEIRLEAFAGYHGPATPWLEVDFRLAQKRHEVFNRLQRADLDVIYALPLDWRGDYAGMASDNSAADLRLATDRGLMLCFLAPNFLEELHGGCLTASGRRLSCNPLRDRRVRSALSMAIDRRFICDVLLGGMALPAGDIVPAGVFGSDPELIPDPYEPGRARALLEEAGFADGLIIEAAHSEDVPTYQLRALRALELMLAGVGISVRWNVLGRGELHDHSNADRFGLKYQYWTCSTGDSLYNLQHLVATPDERTGAGATNFGRYSSMALDELIRRANCAADRGERAAALRRAGALAMADRVLLPLYYPDVCWAYRGGYRPLPNAQAATLAKWIERDGPCSTISQPHEHRRKARGHADDSIERRPLPTLKTSRGS
jgi:peptide/nickel transport system substrate-binding protein